MEKLELGTKLNGRYLLKGFIGEGNMSYVYEAFDDLLKRVVAIKQMNIPFGSWDVDSIIKRFKREYNFLSAIEHPNVVKAHGFFSENNDAFMVLELIKGLSLQEMIEKRKNHISISINLSFAIQLARAIEVINTAGIIHRDIKPTNIIVNETTKRLKLLDLGVATFVKTELSRLTNHGEVVGTPDYLSPEQVGGQVAANSDIFSVGVVLYQLFSGDEKSPFHSDNAMTTMMSITTQKLPPLVERISAPSALYQKTYQRISDVLQEAMQINPEDRISDAGTLAQKFEEILGKYRAEKSQLKERKTVILQNWVVSEKTDPDPEVMSKLRKLGDQFGRDDVSYRRPSSRRISSAIKRSKRYEKTKKSNWAMEWLIILTIFLVIVLFLIIDSSSSEKKMSQSDLNNIAIEELQSIKKLDSRIERWHQLTNFETKFQYMSPFIYDQVAALLKKEEDLIVDEIDSVTNIIKNSNIFEIKEINNVLQWISDANFLVLLRQNIAIKNKYDIFLSALQNYSQNDLLFISMKDFYRNRNLEQTKRFFKNITPYINESSKALFNKCNQNIAEYEQILYSFREELFLLKEKNKLLSIHTINSNQTLSGVLKNIEVNTFTLLSDKNETKIKIFNIDETLRDNLLKIKSIDSYYPSISKSQNYVSKIFDIAYYGEEDYVFCSELAIKAWQEDKKELLQTLMQRFEKDHISSVELELFDQEKNSIQNTLRTNNSKVVIYGKISGYFSPLITEIRVLHSGIYKGKKFKKKYSKKIENNKFVFQFPLSTNENKFSFIFQQPASTPYKKNIRIYRQ